MPQPWSCPCNDQACIGHCPRCNSKHIGGGGANGMFCATCHHCWDDDASDHLAESFLDYFNKVVSEQGTDTD